MLQKYMKQVPTITTTADKAIHFKGNKQTTNTPCKTHKIDQLGTTTKEPYTAIHLHPYITTIAIMKNKQTAFTTVQKQIHFNHRAKLF